MKNNEKVIAKPNNIFTDLSQNVSQKDQKVAEDNSGAYNKDKELKDINIMKSIGVKRKYEDNGNGDKKVTQNKNIKK